MATTDAAASCSLADRWADITIDDEEDGGLSFEGTETPVVEEEIDSRWCLVARLVSDRSADGEIVKHRMAFLWRPGKGMYVKELSANLFHFQFFHEVDVQRVLEGSPWTFNNTPRAVNESSYSDLNR